MAVVRALVSQLVKRLLAALAETLTKTGIKALVKDAVVGAAVGTGISLVQDVAIQAYQVHEGVRSGIDWKQTLEVSVGAVVGGAVGSVAHGLLSKSLGESTNIGAKVLKGTVTHFGVGTVGNVAGAGAAGGGLDAEDIFGGAGGGAISGGVHGASKHPEGEAHGESSEEKSESTQASSTSDDDDKAGSTDGRPATNSVGPENDSTENATAAPPDASVGRSGEAAGGDPSTTATVSSATNDSPTAVSSATNDSPESENRNSFSDNDSGALGSGQQSAGSETGTGNGLGQGSRSVDAASSNPGAAPKSPSAATSATTAPTGHQTSAPRGPQSDATNAARPATASSEASPSNIDSTEGASRPTQAGRPNPSAAASAPCSCWPRAAS